MTVGTHHLYFLKFFLFKVEFPSHSVTVEFSEMLNSVEFARQLVYLSENRLIRSVLKLDKLEHESLTDLVSQWLIPMLSNRRSKVVTGIKFPVISKKIRDNVLGVQTDESHSFRRSPIYTVIKVLLQIDLTVKLGEARGKFLYKLVMLKYLTTLANFYTDNLYQRLNIDLANQMIAKIARRIEKLSIYDPDHFDNIRKIIVNEAIEVIHNIRSKIDKQIEDLQNESSLASKLEKLTGLNFEGDVVQKVAKLREHIEARKRQVVPVQGRIEIIAKRTFRYDLDSDVPPNVEYFDRLHNSHAPGVFLNDFENYVLYKTDLSAPLQYDAVSLRYWLNKYGPISSKYYAGDQLGNSRMLLTQLKIFVLLDKMVTRNYHLYNGYRCGVNAKIFNNLILPQRCDMEIAEKLQQYIAKRNKSTEADKQLPGFLESDRITEESFAVRFFDEDFEMEEILSKILEKDQVEENRMQSKYKAVKKQATKLREQSEPLNCTCDTLQNGTRKRVRCAKCKIEADLGRLKLERYEKSLPQDKNLQQAIVFELAIPDEIACLRDALFEITNVLHEQPIKSKSVKSTWTTELRDYNRSISERVFLGSKMKPAIVGRGRYVSVTQCSFGDCFFENERNCEYYTSVKGSHHHLPAAFMNQTIAHLTVFKVEKNSPYSNLQYALAGGHTQNHVLASQYQCSQDLLLAEYVNFGSLRADGYQLQLHKLYTMIATESLSLETKSALALIMQTLWEFWPHSINPNCQPFAMNGFTLEMCKLIENLIEQQKCNWKSPTKLIIATIITVRMMEMNETEEVVNRIVNVLTMIRDVALDWIKKVENAMDEPNNSFDNLQKLRQNLVETSIAGALTFYVDSDHDYFDQIFVDSEQMGKTSPQIWLEFLITINKNIMLNATERNQSDVQTLLRLVHRIGARIQVKMHQLLNDEPKSVIEFIKEHWHPSKLANFQYAQSTGIERPVIVVATTNTSETFIQIDIITGELNYCF